MPLLSLASGVLPEFTPLQTATAAAASGWEAVGLWVETASWTASTTRDLRSLTSDAGLRVMDVEVVWIKPGNFDPNHLRLLDIGLELGADNVLVVSSDPDMDATATTLQHLVAHVRGTPMRVALEFAAFTEIRSLTAALAVLARPGLEDATLLIDPLHYARLHEAPAALAALPQHLFSYAQLCDAPAVGPHADDTAAILHEALDLRLMPGEGELPLFALLDALPHDLPLSIELRSKALRDNFPDPAERARALLKASRRMIGEYQTRHG
jgi:sugar phosphate isomerase/epimerase